MVISYGLAYNNVLQDTRVDLNSLFGILQCMLRRRRHW